MITNCIVIIKTRYIKCGFDLLRAQKRIYIFAPGGQTMNGVYKKALE
jgi:hypothetical protein